MLIDGFTVIAQVINFLILVFLLHRFLYRPIANAMSRREAKIAAELSEANTIKQEALREAEAYRAEREALKMERERLLHEARQEAEAQRKEMMKATRAELEASRAHWQAGLAAEKEAFLQDVRQRIGRLVLTISRRALADLADADLEQRMIDVFTRHLGSLSEREREILSESILKSGRRVLVRSRFELPVKAQQQLLAVLQNGLLDEIELQMEIDPDLLCGVELRALDHRVAWTLDDYLTSLDEHLLAALDEETEAAGAG